MLVVCGGALLIGMAVSLVIPFSPFAAALTVAVAVGAGWAALHGTGSLQVLVSALALLVATQIGYGLGLVGAATVDGIRRSLRRPSTPKALPTQLSDLHIGEKP